MLVHLFFPHSSVITPTAVIPAETGNPDEAKCWAEPSHLQQQAVPHIYGKKMLIVFSQPCWVPLPPQPSPAMSFISCHVLCRQSWARELQREVSSPALHPILTCLNLIFSQHGGFHSEHIALQKLHNPTCIKLRLATGLHSEGVNPSMFENFITSACKREQRIVQMSHNTLLYMLALWLH